MRKLATIRQISKIIEIPGADKVEAAIIDGWQVVIKKGEFKENSLCVFFEIDSFLPDDPMYAFLPKLITYKGKQGYRLKTIKLRKTLSQGLALPLDHLGVVGTLGDDVTDVLGIIKYDVAEANPQKANNSQKPAGSFPSFIPKTDQERIQNLPIYFETMKDHPFEETLKLDGSSMTAYKLHKPQPWYTKLYNLLIGIPTKDYHFGVCSRNLELQPDTTSNFWKAAIKYELEERIPSGYAVQGELLAPNIQSNHEKVSDVEFYIFDVYDINRGTYLLPLDRRLFCEFYDLPHVPVACTYSEPFKHQTMESLLKHVEGPSMNPNTISEGRVYKSTSNPEISFKVISNKYLLKSEK